MGRLHARSSPLGTELEGEVKNITEFGLFVGLDGDIDGMVHLSDIDWNMSGEEAIKDYKKGDLVKAQVLDVDVEKERISLGIKQLAGDPIETARPSSARARSSPARSRKVDAGGIEVDARRRRQRLHPQVGPVARPQRAAPRALRRRRAARRPDHQRRPRDAQVSLSIKALEMAEEKEAMEQFGSSDSGASLGDILGAALEKQSEKQGRAAP